MYDFAYMSYLKEPNSQKQKVERQLPRAKELFDGTEVQFYEIKKSWKSVSKQYEDT